MADLRPILVTGANGFVGSAVVRHLLDQGRAVRAGVRSAEVATVAPRQVLGDLGEGASAASLAGIDCIVHCAARAHILRDKAEDTLAAFRRANRDATLQLAQAAASAGVRRFIFLSSAHVNGATSIGRPFRIDDSPRPAGPYAISKLEAEQGLLDLGRSTGLEIVIVRPPLVIGEAPKGNLATLTRAIRSGLPLPLGRVTRNRRDLVSLGNLASLIALSIDHPAAPGGIFLVSDGAPLSTRELVERLARLAGARVRTVPLPASLLRVALKAAGRKSLAEQLTGNLEYDISETKARLGWRPDPGLAS